MNTRLRLLTLAVFGLSLGAACASTGDGTGFDKDGGGTGPGADGGKDGGVVLPGSDAMMLNPGDATKDGIVGDPTTCAEAAASKSYVGCEYWPTVTANGVESIFDFAAVVANTQTLPATVSVT